MSDKKARENKTAVMKAAGEFREFCLALVRDRVNDRKTKQELADALGITLGGVDSFLYYGKGSLDTYVGALFYVYKVDLKTLKSFLLNFREHLKKISPSRPSDKIWSELDRYWSEDEKEYWAYLLRAAARMNYTLGKKKVGQSKVASGTSRSSDY